MLVVTRLITTKDHFHLSFSVSQLSLITSHHNNVDSGLILSLVTIPALKAIEMISAVTKVRFCRELC